MTATTIQQLATDCGKYLVRHPEFKSEDHPNAKRLVLADECPQWFSDLVYKAHGDKLPNDWSFEFVEDAVMHLQDTDDIDSPPDLDSLYPYTADRLSWLSSHLDRPSYCDDAQSEWGVVGNVLELIAGGMSYELEEVYSIIRDGLLERLEQTATDEE